MNLNISEYGQFLTPRDGTTSNWNWAVSPRWGHETTVSWSLLTLINSGIVRKKNIAVDSDLADLQLVATPQKVLLVLLDY